MKLMLNALMCAMLSAGALSEDEMRVVVEQALDQPTKMTIDDRPLPDAIAKIAEKTGLGISIGPDALSYLPYGESTRVNAKLDGCRLRAGIEAICAQLGMEFEVRSGGVEIVPSDALLRLGRRATWDELDTLSGLMKARWKAGSDEFESIKSKIQFRVPEGFPNATWDALASHLRTAGAGRADQVLTAACEAMGCVWLPWDKQIVVLPVEEQTQRQLETPVSLRYTHSPLADVLNGLTRQTGVRMTLDPVAAAQLSDRVKQNFTLLVEGASAEEALIQISVATGLGYRVEGNQVVFYQPEAEQASADAQQSRRSSWVSDPIVGKVVVDGGKDGVHYEFFIRQSDLTAGENDHRRELIRKAVEAMKHDLLESVP